MQEGRFQNQVPEPGQKVAWQELRSHLPGSALGSPHAGSPGLNAAPDSGLCGAWSPSRHPFLTDSASSQSGQREWGAGSSFVTLLGPCSFTPHVLANTPNAARTSLILPRLHLSGLGEGETQRWDSTEGSRWSQVLWARSKESQGVWEHLTWLCPRTHCMHTEPLRARAVRRVLSAHSSFKTKL